MPLLGAGEMGAVHPKHGTPRIDACGARKVRGTRVQGVEPTRLLFERSSASRTKAGEIGDLPVWAFATLV